MNDVSEREAVLLQIATEAVEALAMADQYLDGFVWVSEPEFSELEQIKAASQRARRLLAEVRGAVVKPAVMLAKDDWLVSVQEHGRGENHHPGVKR